ncbi:hypothetical protein V5F38_12205 [Xanthobacter sp. V0B-10]|uniref:hypothetical protein n=1 Tax=Xanthobacter albus TaxID=3119929 RepID=UPI0037291CDF
MAKIVRREVRKRGFFGWIFLLIFLLFNAVMVLWLISYLGSLSEVTAVSEAEKAGRAIGGTIGAGFLLVVWALGAVITGLLAIVTRGSKTIVEEMVEQ